MPIPDLRFKRPGWQLCCPWKPAQVKSPTTLRPSRCKTEQTRGEAVWKDGAAQPAPSSPSHPSWGARHVSEETTLDTPMPPHHMEQKTCPAEPSPGCRIIRNNKLLFGVREEETERTCLSPTDRGPEQKLEEVALPRALGEPEHTKPSLGPESHRIREHKFSYVHADCGLGLAREDSW